MRQSRMTVSYIVMVAIILMAGCDNKKPQGICALISTKPEPDYRLNKPVPGVAYVSINPNTPMGSQVGPGGTWGPKGEDQAVLGFTLFSLDGESCQTTTVTGLPMEVDPNASPFVIGHNFALFNGLDGHLVGVSVGKVTSDGKLNVKLPARGRLEKGEQRYFELHLDTSAAQHGDTLAITSGVVEYVVGRKQFRSYQPRYTPPPLTY